MEHEACDLIAVLRGTPAPDLAGRVSLFLDRYWGLPEERVGWQSELWRAIHELADRLEHFEPAIRKAQVGLIGEREATSLIENTLAVASRHGL